MTDEKKTALRTQQEPEAWDTPGEGCTRDGETPVTAQMRDACSRWANFQEGDGYGPGNCSTLDRAFFAGWNASLADARYESALPIQQAPQAEAVAYRRIEGEHGATSWIDGKPSERFLRHAAERGFQVEFAYSASVVTAKAQEDARDAARYRALRDIGDISLLGRWSRGAASDADALIDAALAHRGARE